MLAETRAFVSDVILAGDARLSTLLTAPYTIADASVAALYGAEIPADTEGPARIELDPQERAGLLTQSAFLTTLANSTQSSFIRRGLYVRTELLCASIPPPPDDVDDNPPSSDEDGLPPRDQWQQHLTNPECAGCHTLIDMPGFAFENYDAIGKYRTKIGGDWPVDATGELVGTDVDGPFTNAIDMVAMLAESDVVHRCMAQQWMRFALARETTSEDACTSEAIEDDFLASGGNIRDLVVGIVQSKSFRLRRR
jgi:hypothetical protein